MQPIIQKQSSQATIYDADRMELPSTEQFTSAYWLARQAAVGQAMGRGSAWFIQAPFGAVVLRRYYRGGWAAKLSRETYFFSTVERSRSFREFKLLVSLHKLGLPVPVPVAAICEHKGIFSRGAIFIQMIERSVTLADMLVKSEGNPDLWASVGQCIREFHNAGVWHADLNARNILIDEDARVYLIDFDRARYTPGQPVSGTNNLSRLKRSLEKLWPENQTSHRQDAWERLEKAYNENSSSLPLLRVVRSKRLKLVAATTRLIRNDIHSKEQLAEALGVEPPVNWPPDLYDASAMRYSLQQLGDPTEQSWSFWYLVSNSESPQLIGICGFKGRPDTSGSVEIGYSVVERYQRQGFATEAVTALVGWAFSHHNVNEVSAETLPHLSQSIRVLEKNGFVLTGPGSESGVVRYAIQRTSLL